tara:strand:+ start:210 stop:434 length:225 start_codon:yes stop_codon:yes gene_type:complete
VWKNCGRISTVIVDKMWKNIFYCGLTVERFFILLIIKIKKFLTTFFKNLKKIAFLGINCGEIYIKCEKNFIDAL